MDKGKRYTFDVLAFPRYHYFQLRLQRLVPRWQRILEAGGLADCIQDGVSRLKHITSVADKVQEQSTVYLFADDHFLKTNNLQFSVQTDSTLLGDIGIESVTWKNFKSTLSVLNSWEPTVLVIVQHDFDKKIGELLSGLTDEQLGNVIIYMSETKTNVLYTDLLKADFQIHDIEFIDNKALIRNYDLAAQIQYILEGKAVSALELITNYIYPFVPKDQQELEKSIQDLVYSNISTALKNEYLLSDLEPSETALPVKGRQMMDKDFSSIKQFIDSDWFLLTRELGVSDDEMKTIKLEKSTFESQIIAMLSLWRDKFGAKATLIKLLEVMEKVSEENSIDFPTDDIIRTLQTMEDRNDIFQHNVIEFVMRKAKCVACDNLSKKHGIPAYLVNEFMNEGFFSFDQKIQSIMKVMTLPTCPEPKTKPLVLVFQSFIYRLGFGIMPVIGKTEDYVNIKVKILNIVMKLQFELFGMLRLTDVVVNVDVPPLTVLSEELQEALLGIDDVQGCGTFYGELTLHVTKHPSPSKIEEIRELLDCFHYRGQFKWEIKVPVVEQASGELIEPGHLLRGQCLPGKEEQHSYGSLGCFVKVRPRDSNVVQNSTSTSPGTKVSSAYLIQEESVHAITCAHCVKDCQENIDVKKGNTFVPLGRKKCEVYYRDLLDVATIKVDEVTSISCDSKIKRSDESCTNKWFSYIGNPSGIYVHKEGSASNFTRGVVICTDYSSRLMRSYKLHSLAQNVLIGSEADIASGARIVDDESPLEGALQFSTNGDSGSVVCADNPADDSVFIVSLLIGAVSTPGSFRYSYSSPFQKTLQELQERYDVDIVPTQLSGPPPSLSGIFSASSGGAGDGPSFSGSFSGDSGGAIGGHARTDRRHDGASRGGTIYSRQGVTPSHPRN